MNTKIKMFWIILFVPFAEGGQDMAMHYAPGFNRETFQYDRINYDDVSMQHLTFLKDEKTTAIRVDPVDQLNVGHLGFREVRCHQKRMLDVRSGMPDWDCETRFGPIIGDVSCQRWTPGKNGWIVKGSCSFTWYNDTWQTTFGPIVWLLLFFVLPVIIMCALCDSALLETIVGGIFLGTIWVIVTSIVECVIFGDCDSYKSSSTSERD